MKWRAQRLGGSFACAAIAAGCLAQSAGPTGAASLARMDYFHPMRSVQLSVDNGAGTSALLAKTVRLKSCFVPIGAELPAQICREPYLSSVRCGGPPAAREPFIADMGVLTRPAGSGFESWLSIPEGDLVSEWLGNPWFLCLGLGAFLAPLLIKVGVMRRDPLIEAARAQTALKLKLHRAQR